MLYYVWRCLICDASSKTRKDTVVGSVRTRMKAREHANKHDHPTRWETRRQADDVEVSSISFPGREPELTEAEVFRGF